MRNFTFRKRLIAFAVSAFACLGANAFSVQNGILTITDQDNLAKISYNADRNELSCVDNSTGPEVTTTVSMAGVTTLKFSGDFTSGMAQGWLSNDEIGKSGITKIDLEDADLSGTPSWSFYKFTNLQEIVWPKAGKITVIPELAFADTGIETVTIPGYIKTIKTHAFRSSSGDGYLKTIIFAEYDPDNNGSDVVMHLEREAFNNTTAIYDVYIETEGTMTAALDAFPKDITYSQTQPGAPRATLHFPEDKADLYANPQPLEPKDIASDGAFQKWLNAHNTTASQADNGFFQFVSNGSTSKNGDNWGDVILRTFSHAKLDYVVPKGLKAFRVTNVTANDAGQYVLTLTKTPVIPAGTGVILYGGPNSKDKNGNPTLAMTVVNYTGGKFGRDGGVMNLLMPTSYMDGETEVSGVEIKPYEMDATGKKVEWRTFIMNRFYNTDLKAKYLKKYPNETPNNFVGFFRTKQGTISGGKAYLRLKADEFAQADGNEIIVPKYDDYDLEYPEGADPDALVRMTDEQMKAKGYWHKGSGENITKIIWEEDWGVRNLNASFKAKFSGEPIIELDDEDGVVTLIVPGSMIDGEEAGDYYNLHGVKVSHPTKGIYVKNGKKVVIK